MVSASLSQNWAWTTPTCAREANRHRKGDTYLIGGKPQDPLDPGPWMWKAAPDYRPDRRTGRHRRGELPDPITKLREDAWARFIEHSAVLAEAHLTARKPNRLRRMVNGLRRFLHV